ncbi:ketopantoate hydroxymethyltransferase [Chytridium lagenaria]|nr:ketopantoate hydroxymethyltransferase [Chytridium lagenaria]
MVFDKLLACLSRPSTHQRKKITIQSLQKLYKNDVPITMMTAYDYPSGVFVDKGGIDVCLVGDSLAMVALGYDSTNRITLDEMIHHSKAVARGSKIPFIVGDLPFGTYECSAEQALQSSVRFVREGMVEAVKLEGGVEMASTIDRITKVGIPVLGHIGLTPQRSSSLGGFRVQGKSVEKAKKLLDDARALQEAGCFAIVCLIHHAKITVPTIGIGAGNGCSGQVLVQLDMLGMFDKFLPKFCKLYANLDPVIVAAMEKYGEEVRSRAFPAAEHTYKMEAGELEKFEEWCAIEDSKSSNTL